MTTDSTLCTFVASDGDNLAIQDWPLDEDITLRGVVVVVHGLGEHAGRYHHVAQRLNAWGFAVRGYDQFGHGESGGARGDLPCESRLVDDLADIVDITRARFAPGTPLILLGHSMGGLVVARFVALNVRPIEALVMSSPALDPGLSKVQKLLLAALPRVMPHLSVVNGLDASKISHDCAVVRAYLDDPLVHNRISPLLAKFIAEGGPATVAAAARWTVPTLLMYAGSDALVSPAGSQAFAAAAPPSRVATRCFDHHYHELFNEADREPVFAELRQWLDARF